MNKKFVKTLIAISVSFSLSGCTTLKKMPGLVTGCLVGTTAGVLIGAKTAGKKGAMIGGVAGMIAGCSVGYAFDQHRRALEEIAQQEALDIQFTTITINKNNEDSSDMLIASDQASLSEDDLKQYEDYEQVGIAATVSNIASNGDEMFKSGADKPNKEAKEKLLKIASVYKNSDANILITGHTDSSGGDELNQALSEQRAQYVAGIFREAGISESRLFYQGAGESQPISSNSNKKGRADNRRVEIIQIEGEPEQLQVYAYKQKTNMAYLSRRSQDKVSVIDKSTLKKVTSITNKKPEKVNLAAKNLIIASQAEPSSFINQTMTDKVMINFGGKVMDNLVGEFSQIVGQKSDNSFSLITKAYANELSSLNCAAEKPQVSGDIKQLSTGKAYSRSDYHTSDYLPGMYGTVWTQKINGHFIALSPVAVLRNSGKPISEPEIKIWANYSNKSSSKPDFQINTKVETYYGSKGLLYRLYSTSSNSPLHCMDIVMPLEKSSVAMAGTLYYENKKKVYEVTYKPQMLSQ